MSPKLKDAIPLISLITCVIMIATFFVTRRDVGEERLKAKADKTELIRVEADLKVDIREGDAENAEDLQLHIIDQKDQFNRIEEQLQSINEFLRQ